MRKKKRTKITDKIRKGTRVQYYIANVGGLFLQGQDKKKKELIKLALEKNKNVKQIIENNLDGFPNFYIILNEKYLFGKDPSFFIKRKRTTLSHAEKGLFLAYGNDIKKDKNNLVEYLSIAPTILKLLKFEKPNYMKGISLKIFKNG